MSAEHNRKPEFPPNSLLQDINAKKKHENVVLINQNTSTVIGENNRIPLSIVDRQEQARLFPAVFERKSFLSKVKKERFPRLLLKTFTDTFESERREGETDIELLQRIRESLPSNNIAKILRVNKSEVSRLARSLSVEDRKYNQGRNDKGKSKAGTKESPEKVSLRAYSKFLLTFQSERRVNESNKAFYERMINIHSEGKVRSKASLQAKELKALRDKFT